MGMCQDSRFSAEEVPKWQGFLTRHPHPARDFDRLFFPPYPRLKHTATARVICVKVSRRDGVSKLSLSDPIRNILSSFVKDDEGSSTLSLDTFALLVSGLV